MKIFKISCLPFGCIIAASLLFTACDPNDNEDPSGQQLTDVQSIQDNNTSESLFEDLDNIAQLAMEEDEANERRTESCATVTITPDAEGSGGTIKLDYGEGCEGSDGKTRTGILNITYTDRYFASGSVITVTPENYTISTPLRGTVQVEGERKVTNVTEEGGNPTHRIEVTNGTLTYADGRESTWTSTRTREMTAGRDTPLNRFDDVYSISGSANGTNVTGTAYTIDIVNPLVINTSCYAQGVLYPTSGIMTLNSDNREKSINYQPADDDGGCNRTFSVTVDGREFIIVIQ
ncbi:MAG: hypothetical protein ACFB0B_11085 [Thermonemataceae bacterium]